MSLSFSRVLTYCFFRYKRSFYIFFRHRIVSPIMFFFVHFIVYRSLTRLIHRNKRFFSLYTIYFFFTFLFFIINLRVPPFINFFREFCIIRSIFFFNSILCIFFLLGFLASGVYVYNFFTTIIQGKPNWRFSSIKRNMNELILCVISISRIILRSYILDIIL